MTTATAPTPELLTPAEASVLLRTSVFAVYKMIERGQLPGVVRPSGGRRILIKREALRTHVGL